MRGSASRRRVLKYGALAVTGALGGCSSGETPTRVTAAPGDDGGGGGGGDDTGTTTGSPTATPIVHEFREDFSDDLARFEVLRPGADWSVQERIDGKSAYVDTAGAAATSLLARRGGFRWTGTGTIRLKGQASTDADNRNLLVEFGPVGTDDAWQVQLRLDGGQSLAIEAPDGDASETSVDLAAGDVHELSLVVSNSTIVATVDGSYEARFDYPNSLPVGSVAVGVESDTGRGGAAWYDDVVVRSGE